MAIQTGKCPNCHQINSYLKAYCLDCKARLPWADIVEKAEENERSARAARVAQVEAQQRAARVTASNYPAPPSNSPPAPQPDPDIRVLPNNGVKPSLWIIGLGILMALLFGAYIMDEIDPPSPEDQITYVRPSLDDKRKAMESLIFKGYNEEMEKDGATVRVIEVSLVQESDTKYTGFLTLSDDRKLDVEVAVDQNTGDAIWKVD